MKKIRLMLVDDHAIVRQGLRVLLEKEPDFLVVGEADTGRQAVELACKHQPDVVVMDVAMPGLNGLEATRQIIQEAPAVKVLVLSSYNDEEYVRRVVEWGASGYLLKQTAAEELIWAIHEVAAGNVFYSTGLVRRALSHEQDGLLRGTPGAPPAARLTTREAEVLQLIAEGLPNKGIASELRISVKTVGKHREKVMNKLNIHDIAGLTRYAMSKGIIRNHLNEPEQGHIPALSQGGLPVPAARRGNGTLKSSKAVQKR